MSSGRSVQVSRLALLSMMAVFRDILPAYKIRKLTEQELQVKVTKGVQQMRDYEATLLKAFQAYLKLLRSVATSGGAPRAHRRQALAHCPAGMQRVGAQMYKRAPLNCIGAQEQPA
jgi:nucleolar complex protein 3